MHAYPRTIESMYEYFKGLDNLKVANRNSTCVCGIVLLGHLYKTSDMDMSQYVQTVCFMTLTFDDILEQKGACGRYGGEQQRE